MFEVVAYLSSRFGFRRPEGQSFADMSVESKSETTGVNGATVQHSRLPTSIMSHSRLTKGSFRRCLAPLGLEFSALPDDPWKSCPEEDDLTDRCAMMEELSLAHHDRDVIIALEQGGYAEVVPNWRNVRHYFKLLCISVCLVSRCFSCTDIGEAVRNGGIPMYDCLNYSKTGATFEVLCSFSWPEKNTCILLKEKETFEGNGKEIDLNGINDWEGLFKIAGPSALNDAPVIDDVHMVSGETSNGGGFIIQTQQNHFIVKRCSSSGVIRGRGGGICGDQCSGDILITHCWSSGKVEGDGAGGITGRQFGINGGAVKVAYCYSTGKIGGSFCGGICGGRAGENNNNNGGGLLITLSHSTGRIHGRGSGGICGGATGQSSGIVKVEQCYSLGEISGRESGGITGNVPSRDHGHVSIINCYSRGDITGADHAGGICGERTGENGGTVILTNLYASGAIKRYNAGGLIGRIRNDIGGIIITMCVFDGDTGTIIGVNDADDTFVTNRNLGNLAEITGATFCYAISDTDEEECWDTTTVWRVVEHGLPVLLSLSSPSPSMTPTPTLTGSGTPTTTKTRTVSQTPTPTLTSTSTPTCTETETETQTPTGTATPSTTRTSTVTPTPSATPTQKPRRIFSQLPVQRPPRKVIN